jgi:murein DD-endopeptidase MepM/ murein hydrolase activator NlpD
MKGKLVIGLVTAGLFLAGFGGAVLPASAEPHHFLLKLANGTSVPYTGEPGTAPSTITVAGVAIPVVSVQDLGAVVQQVTPTVATPPPPPAPTPSTPATPPPTTTSSAPAPSSSAPSSSAPSKAPQKESATTTSPSSSGKSSQPSAAPKQKKTSSSAKQKAPVAGQQSKQKTTGHSSKPQAKVKASKKPAKAKTKKPAKAKTRKHKKTTAPAPAPAPAPPPPAAHTPPAPTNPSFSLAQPGPTPMGVPNFFIDKFRIPPFLLPIYQAAGVQYGIRWEILAAINEIETDYGRNLNVSSAGAVGWMQFMPATWAQYGTDANHDGKRDPYNPVDAIFATARYLKAAGGQQDINRAIFAYNHAGWYVDSVLMRSRLIAGLPADLVGSLTGLTQGHFPVHAEARYADDIKPGKAAKKIKQGNAALPVESKASRRGINIYAKPGSPVIAVQDGRIVKIGQNQRLGKFIMLRDVYGNTYTYGRLKKLAHKYPVPKEQSVTPNQVDKELSLSTAKADPKPTAPATAGKQAPLKAQKAAAKAGAAEPAAAAPKPTVAKERLFANPYRPRAYNNGGEDQLFHSGAAIPGFSTFKSFFTEIYGLKRDDVELQPLKVGSKVIAGTILGRIGKTDDTATHVLFEIRPAGKGAPRIDPKPILDGWKLLESTAIYRAAGKNPFFGPDAKNPSIGQILLMSKESLQQRVLHSPNIKIYACGRRDIEAGDIDRRVLATLEFLAASGLKPTVSALHCGHSYLTTSGNVSEHSSGNAVDIAAINDIPILGHQGPGSITDITIRRLLTLQGAMKPHQIISLMTFPGTDNTLSLPDHNDHIHVGFRPLFMANAKLGSQLSAVLQPGQWAKLMKRLGEIDNPVVPTTPSKYSLDVKSPVAAGAAGSGD